MKVSLDSRLIKKGEYFVPVTGENFDGHKYIDEALSRGAAGVMEKDELFKRVKKKLKKIKPKIIGITGSSGKSTTTWYLYKILSSKLNVCRGNLNTKLGLSVDAINNMKDTCKIFVAEMGMDRIGEIKETAQLFPPDIAVITTINPVHAEKLGSLPKIVSAKGEILSGLKKSGRSFLNKENKYVRQLGRQTDKKVVWFDSKPLLDYPSRFLGDFTVRNLNVCTLVARNLGFTDKEILSAINELKNLKGRLHPIDGIHGSVIIDDTYNANPESVKYALDVLSKYEGKRKIAILGDMLELGRYKKRAHVEIGKHFDRLDIDIFIGVGSLGRIIFDNVNSSTVLKYWITDSSEFVGFLKKERSFNIERGDVIMVKGSQGNRMERIVKVLMKDPKKASELLVRQDVRWG